MMHRGHEVQSREAGKEESEGKMDNRVGRKGGEGEKERGEVQRQLSQPPLPSAQEGAQTTDEMQRRRQERMRGAGTHAIQQHRVSFPALSPSTVSTDANVASSTPPPPPPTLMGSTTTQPALLEPVGNQVRTPTPTGPRSDIMGTSSGLVSGRGWPFAHTQSPLLLHSSSSTDHAQQQETIEDRKQERVRGAGTHVIRQHDVSFPEPIISSPVVSMSFNSSVLDSSRVTAASDNEELQRAVQVPTMKERMLERMRGAGTHPIQKTDVAFSGLLPSSASASVAEMENVFSDGTMTGSEQGVQRQIEPSPSDAQADGSLSLISSHPVYDRRQIRMRGAGTHAIQPKSIGFPDASFTTMSNATPTSMSSAMDEEQTPTHAEKQPHAALKDRRQQRIRGAGTHAIQEQHVLFSRPSSDSTMTQAMSGVEKGTEKSQRTVDDHVRQDPFIDPRLFQMDAMSFELLPEISLDQDFPAEDVGNAAENDSTDRLPNAPPTSVSNVAGKKERGKQRLQTRVDHEQLAVDLVTGQTIDPKTGKLLALKFRRPLGRLGRPRKEDTMDIAPFDSDLGNRTRGRPRKVRTEEEQIAMGTKRRVGRPSKKRLEGEPEKGKGGDGLAQSAKQTRDAPRIPLWFIPQGNRPKEEQDLARREFRNLVTLAAAYLPRRTKLVLRVNDADTIYTVIKREFARAARSEAGAEHADLLDGILGRILPTFRRLSEQATERLRLMEQLSDARRKKLNMRKIVFEKRSQVLRVLRAVNAVRQQQQRRQEKATNEESITDFLTSLRQLAPNWNDAAR